MLLAAVTGLIWFGRKDAAEFTAFKAIADTHERVAHFRRWTLRSLLLFGGSALAGLAILGRLDALFSLPAEFGPLASLPRGGTAGQADELALLPVLAGAGLAMALGMLLTFLVLKRLNTAPKMIGDVDSMIPRNRAEAFWTFLMSLNAGFSEELFFRLLLPLLLVQLTGSALAAFIIATLMFGAAHLYQGWKGIAMTAALGAAMAAFYLLTGSLWVAIAVHVLMNVNGLILRPFLMARSARSAPATAGPA
jgi:membrane protease YdiL (CAAX protease family)